MKWAIRLLFLALPAGSYIPLFSPEWNHIWCYTLFQFGKPFFWNDKFVIVPLNDIISRTILIIGLSSSVWNYQIIEQQHLTHLINLSELSGLYSPIILLSLTLLSQSLSHIPFAHGDPMNSSMALLMVTWETHYIFVIEKPMVFPLRAPSFSAT